jgi:hypothetical protein
MSGRGGDHEGVVKLAESELDMLKEIAPKQIAPYRHGADSGIKGETSKVGMKNFDPMNAARQRKASAGCKQDLRTGHEIDPKRANHQFPVEDREIRASIELCNRIDCAPALLWRGNRQPQSRKQFSRITVGQVCKRMGISDRRGHGSWTDPVSILRQWRRNKENKRNFYAFARCLFYRRSSVLAMRDDPAAFDHHVFADMRTKFFRMLLKPFAFDGSIAIRGGQSILCGFDGPTDHRLLSRANGFFRFSLHLSTYVFKLSVLNITIQQK